MRIRAFMIFVLFGSTLFFLNAGDNTDGKKIATLPELTKPSKIMVSGDELFVVNNRYNILIYSLKDFKLKKQFGKKGEGPGEFKYSFRVSMRPDFIFVDSQDRISWFSKEGKFLKQKNKKLQSTYIPLKNKFIVWSIIFLSDRLSKNEIAIYDSELKKIKVLEEYERELPMPLIGADDRIKEWKMIRDYYKISYDITSGKIFIFDTINGFYINVFDENGSNLYTINKDKEIGKIEVSDEYKEKEMNELKQESLWREFEAQKTRLIFPKYFPSFRWAEVNNGKIYIHTYKRKDNKTQFVILDLQGKILKEIYLPEPGHYEQTVYDDKLYRLVENEEKETWELYVYNM